MKEYTYLFLPGILCDETLFAYQLERLRWDGIGADLTQDETIEAMAQRALGAAPEDIALVGLGLGGVVALEIIRQAPERVLSAVLFSTPYQPMPAERQATYRNYIDTTADGHFDDVVTALIGAGLVSELKARIDPSLVEQVREMAQRVGEAAFARQATALLERRDYTPVLESCPCFVQVVAGDMDKVVDWAIGDKMTALLPKGKFEMLHNCGHLSPWEQPLDTIRMLLKWQRRFAMENITEAKHAEEPD